MTNLDDEGIYIPQAKILRVLKLIMTLYHGHYAPEQIAELLDCSTRTAYRYIHLIDEIGISIESDFSKRFFIAQDDCPLCHTILKQSEFDEVAHDSKMCAGFESLSDHNQKTNELLP